MRYSFKSFRIIVIVIIVAAAFTISAFAQSNSFARRGTTELSGTVSFNSFTPVSNGRTGDATTIFNIAPQVGYFITDGFELGLSTGVALLPGVTLVSPSSGSSSTITQLFLSPSYNFIIQESNIYPFLEGDLGYTSISSGSSGQSGFSYGFRGGIKSVPVEHVVISTSVQYYAITLNSDQTYYYGQSRERDGFNYLTIGVGIGVYF